MELLIKILVPVIISIFGIGVAWGVYKGKFGIIEKVAYKNRANIEATRNDLIKISADVESINIRCEKIEADCHQKFNFLNTDLCKKLDRLESVVLDQKILLEKSCDNDKLWKNVVLQTLKMVAAHIVDDIPDEKKSAGLVSLIKTNSDLLSKLEFLFAGGSKPEKV